MDTLYKDVLVELECPVCTDYITPPIRQCQTGHSICESCMKKLDKCPICQQAFTNSKNIALESLAYKIRYPCINDALGCNVQITLQEKPIHEANCTFKGIKCAKKNCQWLGRKEGLTEHWQLKHCSVVSSSITYVVSLKVGHYYIDLIKIHNELFWFKLKQDPENIFWAVQQITNNSETKKYTYQVTVSGSGERKITFTDCCQSVNIDEKKLFREEVCASIGVHYITRFFNEDYITCYLEVWCDKK